MRTNNFAKCEIEKKMTKEKCDRKSNVRFEEISPIFTDSFRAMRCDSSFCVFLVLIFAWSKAVLVYDLSSV